MTMKKSLENQIRGWLPKSQRFRLIKRQQIHRTRLWFDGWQSHSRRVSCKYIAGLAIAPISVTVAVVFAKRKEQQRRAYA